MTDRIWDDAQEKIQAEGACRVCGRTDLKIDCAHISGRVFDKPKPGRKTKWVDPDDVLALCGPFPKGCHGAYDLKRLGLTPFLTAAEQVKAVKNFGSIEIARRHLDPPAFRETPPTDGGADSADHALLSLRTELVRLLGVRPTKCPLTLNEWLIARVGEVLIEQGSA